LAEQQRRGAYVGLAFATALVVLTASGVAISRLDSDDRPRRSAETASPAQAPEPSGSPAAGQETSGPPGTAASDNAAASSSPAPVPPPVPAQRAVRRSAANPSATSAASPVAAGEGAGTASGTGDPESTRTSGAGTAPDPSGSGGSQPPSNQGEPESPALLAASVSVGQGANGAVVGAGMGNSPEADVTVGSNHVVGDAPPSNGTAVEFGGRLLHPPPTIPTLPG
jgi:hypothetical protein